MSGRSFSADSQRGHNHVSNLSDGTDAAIGVQNEFQRGFVRLVKALTPNILDTINKEVPRWIKKCCQDTNYFSSGLYRQAVIRKFELMHIFFKTNHKMITVLNFVSLTIEAMGELLFFTPDSSISHHKRDRRTNPSSNSSHDVPPSIIDPRRAHNHQSNSSFRSTGSIHGRPLDRTPSSLSDRHISEKHRHRRTHSGASYASSIKVAF